MILIGDIGINHDGSLEKALELIKIAKENGFDVVKFQKRTPEICVPEEMWNQKKVSVFGETTYLEYKKLMEFGKEEYDAIDKYCKEIGIQWTASVWDLPSLYFILEYDIPFIKIPSACLTNDDLIIQCIENNKPIILSTGMSTIEEIDHACSLIPTGYDFTLLHCNSSYPCPLENINLNNINMLQDRYPDFPVGYSGHETGIYPTVIAIAMGVPVVERHITYDKEALGSDHKCSLDPKDMLDLNISIRAMNIIKGNYDKELYPEELEMAKKLRNC